MVRTQLKFTGVKQKLPIINGVANPRDRRQAGDLIKDQYAANYNIRHPQVRLVGDDGSNHGVIDTKQAIAMAQLEDLDLVLVNTSANPPVARICDYNKFIYEQKRHKKEQDRKLREHAIVVKEIQLRPSISNHDLDIKLQHAREWLADNCKIKIVVKFRGREMAYKSKGFEMINNFVDKLGCKIEKAPDMNNNTLIAMVAPGAKTTK